MATWNDLANSIHNTGEIDANLVLDIAEARAHREFEAWEKVGLPRSWAKCFAEAVTLTLTSAQTIRDNEIAMRLRAALPASEQWARTAELQAEIAETAIPPRHAEAAWLRRKAAALRVVEPVAIAAE